VGPVTGWVMPDLVGRAECASFTLRDEDSGHVYRVEVWNPNHERVVGFHDEWPTTPRGMFELRAEVQGGRLYDDGSWVLRSDAVGDSVTFLPTKGKGVGGDAHKLWKHRAA